MQHATDTTVQYQGNPLHLEANSEQGMLSKLRTTDNLIEGNYISWLCRLDSEGTSQYTAKHCESLPVLESKSGWIMTPIPGLLSSTPMGEENTASGVDLVPIAPVRVTLDNRLSGANQGWLYLFINGHLWRECRIEPVTDQASRYSDVNLITMQGKDQREATGKPEESIIWVPKLINGKAVDLRIAHSTEQWSWDYIRRMGDPENDPRFIDEIHNATELKPANAGTPDFLIVDPKARLTPIDLSRYDADQPVQLPPDTPDIPTPNAFTTLLRLLSGQALSSVCPETPRLNLALHQPE
ncbi:MAG: hypothetical protein P8X74_23510 [Reinekea sp.]